MSSRRLAIVGAGIVGLAHAYAAAKRGDRVTVFERDDCAVGASVRNFGLGLVLGQPQGDLLDLAKRSRDMWLGLLPAMGCWHKAHGSVIVARHIDEQRVLEAFQAAHGSDYATELIPSAALADFAATGVGGLYSPWEIALEARRLIPVMASWLANEYGVAFRYGTQVNAITLPAIDTSHGRIEADEVIICAGHDFQTLYPDAYATRQLRRCTLQMLRVANPGVRIAPTLLTGLSTLHYPSFTQSSALREPLAALRARTAATEPILLEQGIHLIVQQLGDSGELIIGDSHDYGTTPSPFHAETIDQTLLTMASHLLGKPLTVTERWQGVYASGSQPYCVFQPDNGVRAVVISTGIGMSIALALAERQLTP